MPSTDEAVLFVGTSASCSLYEVVTVASLTEHCRLSNTLVMIQVT
jgi:hypothetical protein